MTVTSANSLDDLNYFDMLTFATTCYELLQYILLLMQNALPQHEVSHNKMSIGYAWLLAHVGH